MFDRIAGLYDRMNSVMTAGLHHQWRRRAADLAELSPGDRALDVATGTGDLALELAGRVGAGGEVVGVDFAEKMLELARAKAGEHPGIRVRFESGNALALPYPTASSMPPPSVSGPATSRDLAARALGDGAGRPARRAGS